MVTAHLATLRGALFVLVTATSASAQSGVYVTGAAFADVREFGSYHSNGTGSLFRSTDNSAMDSMPTRSDAPATIAPQIYCVKSARAMSRESSVPLR
jgi:hypothetical protein